jgi:hypothetical protein
MTNGKRSERKRALLNLGYSPDVCPEGLRKTTKHISQDNRSQGRDLNPEPPGYKVGVLTPNHDVRLTQVQKAG